MDNVLIDDRRIHVDFSQSVAKVKWKGKGLLFIFICFCFALHSCVCVSPLTVLLIRNVQRCNSCYLILCSCFLVSKVGRVGVGVCVSVGMCVGVCVLN